VLFRSHDRDSALKAAQKLSLIDPAEPAAAREALHALLETVLRVFQPSFQPVEFQDKRFVDEAGEKLKGYYGALTCSPPPAQLLFLHRKLGGVYSMGRALKARLQLGSYADNLRA